MSTATSKKANNQLSDGRSMRAMEGSVTQMQMFNPFPRGRFNPAVEGVAKVKDVDDALNISRIYAAVMGSRWVRTDEYGVYHRDPNAPLGRELLWVERGVLYRKIIPDVPVQFNGREISLQKVVGVGIYPSISLLKGEQTDENEFTVSPVSLDAIAGKVRAMNFMRNGWAEPDEHGFPDGDKPNSVSSDTARYGWVRTDFDNKATGYHGSLARGVDDCVDDWRDVFAGVGWSSASGVALVGHDANVAKGDTIAMLQHRGAPMSETSDIRVAPLVRSVPIVGEKTDNGHHVRSAGHDCEQEGAAAPGVEVIKSEGELIVRGTPEQLEAAARLLEQLKK